MTSPEFGGLQGLMQTLTEQQPDLFSRLARTVAPLETTKLTLEQELMFRNWARDHNITDVDNPSAHYDYRGFWLSGGKQAANGHFTDTFKQHGHPTFSVESKYSLGPGDGGTWNGEKFTPPTRQDSLTTIAALQHLITRSHK